MYEVDTLRFGRVVRPRAYLADQLRLGRRRAKQLNVLIAL